jgi:hypothetical protein
MKTLNYTFATMFFGLSIAALIGVICGAWHQAFMACIAGVIGFVLLNAKPSKQ